MEPRLLAFILFGLGTLDLSLGITGAAEEFSKRLNSGQDFHRSGQIQDFDFSKFFPDIEKTHPAPSSSLSNHESRSLPNEESADMYGGYSASHDKDSIETYDQLEGTFEASPKSQPEERQAFQIPSEFQSFDGPAVEPAALTAAEEGFELPSDFNLPGPLPESGGSISGPEFSVPNQFRDTESFEEPEQLRNPGQFALPREVTDAGNINAPFDGFSAPFGSSNSFLNLLGNSNLGAFGGSNFGKRLDRKGSQEESEDRSPPGFYREPKKRFTLQDEIDIVKKYQKKQAQTASIRDNLQQSRQSPNTYESSNGFGSKFELLKFERPNEDLSGALDSFEPSYEKYDFQENFQSRFQDKPAYSYQEPQDEPPKSNNYRTKPKVIDTFNFGPRHNNPSNNDQFRTPNEPSNHFQYDYDQDDEEKEDFKQPSFYRGYSNEQDSFREEAEESQGSSGGASGFGPGLDSFAPEFDSTENPGSYRDYDRPKRFNSARDPTHSAHDRGFVSTFDSPNPFGGSSIGLSPPNFVVNVKKTAQQLTPKEDYRETQSSFGQGGGFPGAYFGGQFTEEEQEEEPVEYASPQQPFFSQQREKFPQRSREPESPNSFHFGQPVSSENTFSSYAREASKTYPSYREPDHSQNPGYDSEETYDAVPNSYENKLVDLRSKIFDGQKFNKFGFAEKSGPVYQEGFKDRSGEEVEFFEDSSDEPREPTPASYGAVNPVEYSFHRFAGYPGFPETLASTTVLDSRTESVTEKMSAEVPYTHQDKNIDIPSEVESSPYESSKFKEETEHFRPQESKESFQHHFDGFNFGSSGYEKVEKLEDTRKQLPSSNEATTESLPLMDEPTTVYNHRGNHGLKSYDVSKESKNSFRRKKEGSSKKKYAQLRKKFDPSQEKKHPSSPFKLEQKSSFREPTKSESFETVDVAFDASTAFSNPTIAPEMTTPQPTLDYPNTKFVAPTPEEGFKPMGGSTKVLDTLLQETATSTPLPPTTYEYTEISFREPITSTLANEEGHSQPPFSTTKPTKGPIYYKSFKQSSSKETIRSYPAKSPEDDVIDVLADSLPRARPNNENHSGELKKPYRRSYTHKHNSPPPVRGSPKNNNRPQAPNQQKHHHRPIPDKQQRLAQHLQSQQQQQQAQLSRPQKPNGPVPRRQRINQNQRLKSLIKQHLPKRRPNGQIRANLPGGLTLNWPPKKNQGPVAKNMAKNIRRVTDLFSSKERDQRKPKANIRQVSAVVLPYVAGAMVSSPLVAAII